MKNLFASIAICFLLSISLSGQNNNEVRVDVPFPFVVNGTMLPSGLYDIRGTAGGESFLKIQNEQSGEVALVTFQNIQLGPGHAQENTRLIFTKDNNKYVLHQVRLAGDSHTHDLITMNITEPAIKPDE